MTLREGAIVLTVIAGFALAFGWLFGELNERSVTENQFYAECMERYGWDPLRSDGCRTIAEYRRLVGGDE